MNTVRSDVLLDPGAWRSFTNSFDQDPDQFAYIPGLVDPEPLLAGVLRATAEFRRHDHTSNPRLRVFSDNQLDYPAIERFCFDTPATDDAFEFLETHVSVPACIGMNELESWDPELRELAAAEFIPGLAPYLRRTSSRADLYAFLTTGGWTPFGLHNDSEPSLVMNLGPSDRELWVWEPQVLGGLDRGRRTTLSFDHLLPAAAHHLVLAPGDFASIPASWFHVFRSHGRSTLFGIAPYPRDVPMEICDYLRHRGVDPLQWFSLSDNAAAAERRIAAVRRHVDLMVESAVFSTAAVRATPLGSDTELPQALRALSSLIVVELPTLLLANGFSVLVPADVGADNVASWLRETPTFSPSDFAERFPDLPVVNGIPELLGQLKRAGVLALESSNVSADLHLRSVVESFGGSARLRESLRNPSQVLLSEGGCESARYCFGVQRVDEILSLSTLDPYVVALHDTDAEVDQRHFIATEVGDGQILKRTLRGGVVRDALRRGLTLTLNGVDRFDATAQRNREYLEYAAGTVGWCNVYVSRAAMSPFDTHTDTHHVVAVQGEGSKHWTVVDPNTGVTAFDDWLHTGQALFVPAHWPHKVHSGEEVSVHWTFGLSPHLEPYLDLQDTVARSVVGGPLYTIQAALKDYLGGPEVRLYTDLHRRRTGPSLAYSLLNTELLPLGDITVRFASRLPPVLGHHDTAVLVVAAGSLYKVDRRLIPLLDVLSDGGDISACVLAGEVGEKATRTFIDWGVGNGLLIASVERKAYR